MIAGDFRDRQPRFRVGQRVRWNGGVGDIEFVANSSAMDSCVYTIAIDTRIKLRVIERDLEVCP